MQWNGGWNAGFSTADPEQLCSPIVSNPVYGYQVVNVDSQVRSEHSLLAWMKRLVRLRRAHRVFGRGSMELLFPGNHRVFAFLREMEEERVLVVANLSRQAQAAELDLRRWQGSVPIEMFGGNLFPPVGESSYLLTLGPYQFYWFRLRR